MIEHEDMVANILATWERATPEQRRVGADWYPTYGRMLATLAGDYGFPVDRVTGAFAWLSPRVTVARNVEMLVSLLSETARGIDPFTSGTTYSMWDLLRKAELVLGGDFSTLALDSKTRARKVRSFYRNLMGDDSVVTVDVWAARVAGIEDPAPAGRRYLAVQDAYLDAAHRVGVSPTVMQAVTWVVARGASD